MSFQELPWPLLLAIATLVNSPLSELAHRLRDALLPYMKNSALVIFTEDCTGRPQKTAGQEEIISRVSIVELDDLRTGLADEAPWFGEAGLAGRPRAALALTHASSQALLVLTDPDQADPGNPAGWMW